MKNFKITFLIAVALGLGACGGRRMIENFVGSSSAQAPGLLTVRTGWLKDKKKRFDAELWFTNEAKTPIVIPVGRISCAKGALTGSFRFAKYGAYMLELQPGEQKRLIALCDTYDKTPGDFSFSFKDIAEADANGGAAKVLHKELVLKLTPAPK